MKAKSLWRIVDQLGEVFLVGGEDIRVQDHEEKNGKVRFLHAVEPAVMGTDADAETDAVTDKTIALFCYPSSVVNLLDVAVVSAGWRGTRRTKIRELSALRKTGHPKGKMRTRKAGAR